MFKDVLQKSAGTVMSQEKDARFLILFGAVFLSVGAVCGFLSLRTVVRAQTMLAWRETPATVVSCELKSESDSDGGTTYRVEATCRYEVNGVQYVCDRVSLHSCADNIGDFQHRIYARLNGCKNRNQPTTCWVNPQNPADAVLIRRPRVELVVFLQLFALAFGGAGLAVIFSGIHIWVRRARKDEGDGLIRMRGCSTHRVMTLIALLWGGYAGWLLWTLGRVLSPDPLPWYLWSLAVVGIVLAAIAGYQWGRFSKFGISVFALSPTPGVLGGPVSGMIRRRRSMRRTGLSYTCSVFTAIPIAAVASLPQPRSAAGRIGVTP